MTIKGANRLNSVKTYYFAKKLAEVRQLNEEGKDIINLGIGSPDLNPPLQVLETFHQAIDEEGSNMYQSYSGIPELRQAFATWYSQNFEHPLNVESEILPLIGSKEGIMHISMSFLDEGDQVLVPDPGYPAYAMATKLAGGEVIKYNLTEENSWLPNFDEISKLDLSKVKLWWINYPHMPTGSNASVSTFEEIIKLARNHNILVCHDNPYLKILNDKVHSIFTADPTMENSIELISLSKLYNMAGFRVGAVAGHQDVLKTILKFKSNMDSGMYKPIQKAAAKALSLGKQWIQELNTIYSERKEVACKIFDVLDVAYSKDSTGLFIWGKINTGESSTEFCDRILYKHNVFITPGTVFGENGEGYVRISICSPKERIETALQRIKSKQL